MCAQLNCWYYIAQLGTIYVKTTVVLEYKQSISNSFKNEIINKLFTYKSYMYIHLNVCKQMINSK